MSNGFNGFLELKKRNDAGKCLVEKYRSMNFEEILNDSMTSHKGYYTFLFSAIELTLVDDKIISSISVSDKSVLLTDAMKKYEMKVKHKETYGALGQMTNLFLATRVLNTMGYKDWDLFIMNNIEAKSFAESMMISNPATLESIVSESKKLIK